jgi:hypothetical protein
MRQFCPPCKSKEEGQAKQLRMLISGIGKESHAATFDPLLVSRPAGALPVADVSGHCIVVGALTMQSKIISGVERSVT